MVFDRVSSKSLAKPDIYSCVLLSMLSCRWITFIIWRISWVCLWPSECKLRQSLNTCYPMHCSCRSCPNYVWHAVLGLHDFQKSNIERSVLKSLSPNYVCSSKPQHLLLVFRSSSTHVYLVLGWGMIHQAWVTFCHLHRIALHKMIT